MRTNLPKLLAKTMSIRRKNHTDTRRTATHNDGSASASVATRSKKKISAISGTKNVCSILRNALTSKKSSSSSSEGDNRVCSINSRDDNESKECSVERELLLEEKRNGSCSLKNVVNKISDPANEKPPTKMSSPFSGFLSKKLNRTTSGNLTRVPSMGFKSFRRTRKDTVMRDEPEAETTEELCKKRILMGGKCRPLNASGALHYDDNGVLLPEEILSCDDEDY